MSVPAHQPPLNRSKRNPKFEWQTAFSRAQVAGNVGYVALYLSLFDNGDGRGLFRSVRQICEDTGLSDRTVRRCISELEESGWLTKSRRGGRRGSTAWASEYRLTYPDDPSRLRAQPVTPGKPAPLAQPDNGALQVVSTVAHPATDDHPLDPSPLDPSSLDHRFIPIEFLLDPGEPGGRLRPPGFWD